MVAFVNGHSGCCVKRASIHDFTSAQNATSWRRILADRTIEFEHQRCYVQEGGRATGFGRLNESRRGKTRCFRSESLTIRPVDALSIRRYAAQSKRKLNQ